MEGALTWPVTSRVTPTLHNICTIMHYQQFLGVHLVSDGKMLCAALFRRRGIYHRGLPPFCSVLMTLLKEFICFINACSLAMLPVTHTRLTSYFFYSEAAHIKWLALHDCLGQAQSILAVDIAALIKINC